jgi:NAD+ synthase (glutamine-hydrolysing)
MERREGPLYFYETGNELMKIAIAQLNLTIGNFEGNLQKMLKSIEDAVRMKADLICLPELATVGYPPRDFLEFKNFIHLAESSITELTKFSHNMEGKDLFNSAYFLYDGQVQYIQHKTLLPTYDVFDEYRYFEPASIHNVLEFKGKKIALTICEDIWNIGNENPMYTVCPLDEMSTKNPDLIINISASPFSFDHTQDRLNVLRANVERYKQPLFYINHVGAQTELLFDGGSVVMSGKGVVHDEMPYFEECLRVYDLDEVEKSKSERLQPKEKYPLIHDGIVMGIRDYFNKLGFKKAIIGLSGGLDSALTAVLAADALGRENVRVILMPSQFSSDHSVEDARQLAENLELQYDIIPIEKPYESFSNLLDPHFKDLPFNVTEENIQARSRGIILMALSNKFGYILLNTTNKSEMAVGYGTLYGDLCGGLSVIGDIYKTEVFELAEYINRDTEIIPRNTIEKPPSAELRPAQKDTDSLPPYHVLDQVLYQYIENRMGPQEIIDMGFDENLVNKALRLVNINEFKRYQTAPVIRVSSKAFGTGRRVPIVGKYLS